MVKKKGKKKLTKKSDISKNNRNNNEKVNNNDDKNNDDNLCIICLENYDNKLHVKRKLKCRHSLCEDCFNKWYKIKESCPICKKNLFPNPSDRPDFSSIVRDLYLHHETHFSRYY